MRVTGVITQGAKRIGSPEYVKSYKIAYSNDGKSWTMYKVKGTNEDMVFRGNVDNNTPYANSFTPPIKSQYIRLYPQVCRRHCTLRMELLGCELSGGFPKGNKNHIITEWLELEGTLKPTQFQLFAVGRSPPLAQAAQGSIQPGPECLQGWGTHSSLGSCSRASLHSEQRISSLFSI
uniref:F5/8 type C domain-containing protein n=2 Tax=Pavo cristatus TaxID=9049 RepID=A0A8C9LBZ8_PAVCR